MKKNEDSNVENNNGLNVLLLTDEIISLLANGSLIFTCLYSAEHVETCQIKQKLLRTKDDSNTDDKYYLSLVIEQILKTKINHSMYF